MFGGSSNVQLGDKLLKFHYTNFILIHDVEPTVSFFFNDFF